MQAHLRHAPLLGFAVALLVGSSCGDQRACCAAWGAAAGLVLLMGALRLQRGVVVCAWIVGVGLGALSQQRAPSPPVFAKCSSPQTLIVSVHSRVQILNQKTYRARVRVHGADCSRDLVGHFIVLRLNHASSIQRGDTIIVKAKLHPALRRRNPDDVESSELLERRSVLASATALWPALVMERSAGFGGWLSQRRLFVRKRLQKTLPPSIEPIASALVLGDASSVEPGTRRAWSRAGIAHLLAISGLHVGLLAMLVFVLCRWGLSCLPYITMRASIHCVAARLAIPAVLAFCVWSGASVSATRATVMVVIAFWGRARWRAGSGLHALSVACIVVILLDPLEVHSLGFSLSFSAALGLVTMRRPRENSLSTIRSAWRASWVTTLTTAPWLGSAFGSLSVVAPLANLVAVPLGTLAVPLALLHAMAPLGETVGPMVQAALVGVLGLLNWAAVMFSGLPFAWVNVPWSGSADVLVVLLCVAALMLQSHARCPRWYLWVTLFACGMVSLLPGSLRAFSSKLHVVIPYVGQAESVVLFVPGGGVVVVDAPGRSFGDGPTPTRRHLLPLLRRHGVNRIDILVLTHPHPDHVGGVVDLVDTFYVAEVWWSGQLPGHPQLKELFARVVAKGGHVIAARDLPPRRKLASVAFDILHPRPRFDDEVVFTELDLNNNSIVMRVRHHENVLLLAGDAEQAAERLLSGRVGKTDILKLGHHGSRTSTSTPWLRQLKPKLAVASCGADNQHGFVHQEVIDRISAAGVKLLRTDLHGQIRLESDGHEWKATTFLN